jgi:hypothetical protein
MTCDLCSKNEATVHLSEVINDQTRELHLCEACAREKGAEAAGLFSASGEQLLGGGLAGAYTALRLERRLAGAADALARARIPDVAQEPPPNCVLMSIKDNTASYAVRYWLTDLGPDDPTDSAVRERIFAVFRRAGLDWQQHVELDPSLLRPAEVDLLQGDASKAARILGWKPRTSFDELVRMMVSADLELARQERALVDAGLKQPAWRDGRPG